MTTYQVIRLTGIVTALIVLTSLTVAAGPYDFLAAPASSLYEAMSDPVTAQYVPPDAWPKKPTLAGSGYTNDACLDGI